jgi:hypothetical protein
MLSTLREITPTKFAIVRPLSGAAIRRAGLRILWLRSPHAWSTALIVTVRSSRSIFRWWSRPSTILRYGQIAHIWGRSPLLKVLQCLLKILHVPLSIADLAVHSRVDLGIVGGLPHGICGVDDRSLPLDLAVQILYRLIFIHLDGVASSWGAEDSERGGSKNGRGLR